jgi:hexosaminidase
MLWTLAALSSFLSGAAALSSPLWPQPTSATLGTTTLHVAPSFRFTSSQPSSFLDQAFDRYVGLINSAGTKKPDPEITSCSVEVAQLHADEISTLQYGVDESYELSLDASGACSIKAGTVWGALHGMETFSQLLERSEEGCVETKFAPVSVTDTPRFEHRGMLIDSSRHYLPMSEIKRMIDTLPMNKFNVLHWHLVDAQVIYMDNMHFHITI